MCLEASVIAASAFGPGPLPLATACCTAAATSAGSWALPTIAAAAAGSAAPAAGARGGPGGGRGGGRGRGLLRLGVEKLVGLLELGLVAPAVLLGRALHVRDPLAE